MPRRKFILMLAAAVVLGAVTMLTVAWTSAFSFQFATDRQVAEQKVAFMYALGAQLQAVTHDPDRVARMGGDWINSDVNTYAVPHALVERKAAGVLVLVLEPERYSSNGILDSSTVERARLHLLPATNQAQLVPRSLWMHRYQEIRGWPLAALGVDWSGRGVIEFGADPADPSRQPIRLPYLPVWLGVVVNTALFAALWMLPLVGIPALRRNRRRRRGLCSRCAYELAGLMVCPECGSGAPTA